jgi:O-antigen ligase
LSLLNDLADLINSGVDFFPSMVEIAVLTLALFIFSLIFQLKHFLNADLAQSREHRLATIVGGAVIGVLAFTGFVLLLDLNNAMLAFELACLVVISLLHPALAFSSWLFLLIFRPWETLNDDGRLAILPRLFFILVMTSFLLSWLKKPARRLTFNRTQFIFLALGGWLFISTFLAPDVSVQQFVFVDRYVTAAIVCCLLFQVVSDTESFEVVKTAIIWSVAGAAGLAILHTHNFHLERLEGEGLLANSNDMAALVILALPLSLGAVLKAPKKLSLWLPTLVLGALFCFAILRAQSRAAFIALAAMLLCYAAMRPKALRSGLAIIVLALGAAVAMPAYLARQTSDLDESSTNRIGYIQAGLKMAIRHPILGVGFGQYPRQYQNYGVSGFSEFGERTAHSSWILILAEAGFPAFFLFAAVYFGALRRAWEIRERVPELAMCLIGYGICMSLISHSYTLYPYLVVALTMSYPFPNEGRSATAAAAAAQ